MKRQKRYVICRESSTGEQYLEVKTDPGSEPWWSSEILHDCLWYENPGTLGEPNGYVREVILTLGKRVS